MHRIDARQDGILSQRVSDLVMYLHLELKAMATERLHQAVARLHYLHGLMAESPGFIEAQICEYLGNPGQYLVVRTWTEAAAHAGYRQSPASREFAASRPAEFIYDNLAVQEWQCVLETNGPAKGEYIVRQLQTISPESWPNQIDVREKHNQDALKLGGVVSFRAYRMLANEKADDTQMLTLDRWSGRDAFVEFLEKAQPAATAVSECYRVVDEVVPVKRA